MQLIGDVATDEVIVPSVSDEETDRIERAYRYSVKDFDLGVQSQRRFFNMGRKRQAWRDELDPVRSNAQH